MKKICVAAVASSLLLLAACKTEEGTVVKTEPAPEPVSWALDAVPAELQPAVEKANASMAALQGALLQKLMPAMQTSGPVGAIDVCSKEAQVMSRQISADQGIALGRTSHKLRNAKNATPQWATAYVDKNAGARAADVQPRAFDLGDRIGVLRPIPTQPMCLSCHGPDVKEDVSAAIAANYPDDRARGFTEGDLRGFFWAEVPK